MLENQLHPYGRAQIRLSACKASRSIRLLRGNGEISDSLWRWASFFRPSEASLFRIGEKVRLQDGTASNGWDAQEG